MSDQLIRERLMEIGIVSYARQDRLIDIARRCAMTVGVPLAGTGAVGMAGAGAVMVPGVGAVPGYIVGLLAGMVTGTSMCVMLNSSMRDELRRFADGI